MLIGYKEFKTRNEARWLEYNLKHHSDKKHKFICMLEAQLKSEVGKGARASGSESLRLGER